MAMDFNKAANDFLNTDAGSKLSGKKEEIGKLIDSPDGRTVKNLLSGEEGSIMTALENGDTDALKKTLSNILKTEEGSRLAEQLKNMMN